MAGSERVERADGGLRHSVVVERESMLVGLSFGFGPSNTPGMLFETLNRFAN